MTFDCSQYINDYCKRLKKNCKPGIKGCILEKKFRSYNSPMEKLGFLGPPGTFCEQAALLINKKLNAELVPLDAIYECIREVKTGKITGCVIPIENSLEGSVSSTLDELAHMDGNGIEIVEEIDLHIKHNLIMQPGTEVKDITDIISHPQALSQCRSFLQNKFPKATTHQASSTARAVEMLGRPEFGISAAIASERIAKMKKYKIAFADISDSKLNLTRFVYLANGKGKKSKNSKTSIIFTLDKDRPGGLYEALGEFAKRNINLTKIESRPNKSVLGEYIFFIDMQGYVDAANILEALGAIEKKSATFKILGSYGVHEDSISVK